MADPKDMASGGTNPWPAMLGRSLKVALVAFVVLQIKELKDAGRFDTVGTAIDGGLIGLGSFLLEAILSALNRGRGTSSTAAATTPSGAGRS